MFSKLNSVCINCIPCSKRRLTYLTVCQAQHFTEPLFPNTCCTFLLQLNILLSLCSYTLSVSTYLQLNIFPSLFFLFTCASIQLNTACQSSKNNYQRLFCNYDDLIVTISELSTKPFPNQSSSFIVKGLEQPSQQSDQSADWTTSKSECIPGTVRDLYLHQRHQIDSGKESRT